MGLVTAVPIAVGRHPATFAGLHAYAQWTIRNEAAAPEWLSQWARLGSNQRPPACEAGALPLSYAPRSRRTAYRATGADDGSVPTSGALPSERPVALGGELAVP